MSLRGIIDLYRDYGDYMQLHGADNLRVHRDRETSVVVLEYEVHGTSVLTGRPYDNRFVSVVTIQDRKVTHWRDYLDPIAVFDTQRWPQGHRPKGSDPTEAAITQALASLAGV
ncbi:nuclear transport factor 2 family protein [Streptomyces sp. HUCO-GS316]|uniref:nuclear transport factor 2 family protein n=1 Tax=Streptomyces sp. HUCO-GS316 TaxID=2692198 RepID=UPI001925F3C7|nr:hypothetical protein [Streptomyces sp. HUCO-GS316]